MRHMQGVRGISLPFVRKTLMPDTILPARLIQALGHATLMKKKHEHKFA
jgi:hypothetical protein